MARLVVKELSSWHNVYARNIVFVFGPSDKVNHWLVRRLNPEEALKGLTKARWILWQHDDHFTDYIVVLERDSLRNTIAALTHEVNHHAVDTMSKAGIPITTECDEPFTYYAEWVLRQCLDAMGVKDAGR